MADDVKKKASFAYQHNFFHNDRKGITTSLPPGYDVPRILPLSLVRQQRKAGVGVE